MEGWKRIGVVVSAPAAWAAGVSLILSWTDETRTPRFWFEALSLGAVLGLVVYIVGACILAAVCGILGWIAEGFARDAWERASEEAYRAQKERVTGSVSLPPKDKGP